MAEKRQKQQAALAADLASKAASVVADNADNEESEESEDDSNNRHDDKAQMVSANSIKAVSDSINQSSAIDLSLADSKLNATHKDMIHELEMHIDDYLTDEMLQMSENLKSWLRAEVSRQLAEKQQTATNATDK